MTEQQISQFKKGAEHVVDERDYVFGAEFVAPYNWNAPYQFTVPITASNQNGSSSCVGQSTMNIAKISYYSLNHPVFDFSARFIYSQIHLPGGGAYMRDGVSTLVKQGICSNVIMPSDPQFESHMQDKTGLAQAQVEAKTYDIYTGDVAYAEVAKNIDSVAAAIRDHGSVIIGATGHNLGWTNADVIPPQIGDGQGTWGHAVTGIQPLMRNGKKAIRFINSWGSTWGDRGTGYFYEDYFQSGFIMVVYVLTSNFSLPQTMLKLIIKNTEQYLRAPDGRDWHVYNSSTLHDLLAAGIISSLNPEPVASINDTGREFVSLVRE